ncbi:hypothetical protein ACQP1O_18555 [Nocardia sp. CA-151230]|uniref:hypothetical protein n=1 Tax=Nocardia sp. CA-151230 TaxID=3239982 RepID=UPI003D8A875E
MTKPPTAIGFLRRDISGTRQQWDETQIRSLAARFGYDLAKILVFGPDTDRPVHRLRVAVSRTGAAAVFVPGPRHFDDARVPAALVAAADVVTVDTEQTYARTSAPTLGEQR